MEPKRKILNRDSATASQVQKAGDELDKVSQEDISALRDPAEIGLGADSESVQEEDVRKDSPQPEKVNSDSRKPWLRKTVFIGAPIMLLFLLSGTLYLKLDTVKDLLGYTKPKKEPVTSIRRPIPIPDYREMLNFIIPGEVDGRKTMMAFRMEVGFQSPTRYQNFKEQNVQFRDAVYSFLLKQNLAKNTFKVWHQTIEKNLLEYIKAQLPQSQADSIVLTQVENV